MKSNLLKNVLDWVLATAVLLSIIFAFQYYNRTKEFRVLNAQTQVNMLQYQSTQQILGALINETVAYNQAKPDAALSKILDAALKPAASPVAPAPTTPTQSATK